VGADGRRGALPGAPVVEQPPKAAPDLSQVGKLAVEVGGLAAHEVANVGARRAARPLDGDDLLDLAEREAEPLRLHPRAAMHRSTSPLSCSCISIGGVLSVIA